MIPCSKSFPAEMLKKPKSNKATRATIFGQYVPDPERFGVVEFDKTGKSPFSGRKTRKSEIQLCRRWSVLTITPRCRICQEPGSPHSAANTKSPT